jgi:hypothetical protein
MDFTYLDHVTDACLVLNKDQEIIFHNQALLMLGQLKDREVKKKAYFSELISFSEIPHEYLAIETHFQFFNSQKGFGQVRKVDLSDGLSLVMIKDLTIEKHLHQRFQEQLHELKDLNQNLEKLVEERTQQLLRTNKYLTGILDSFNQAIFTADVSGKIDLSNGLNLQILGAIVPTQLSEFFQGQMGQEETKKWLGLLFDGALSFEDMTAIAPQNITFLGTPFRMTYYPFYNDHQLLHSLIIALTNITEEVRVRDALNERERLAASLLKASHNGNRFNGALEECREILHALLQGNYSLELARPKLHALKGLFSYYGPAELDLAVHEIEVAEVSWSEKYALIEKLNDQFEKNVSKIVDLLPHLKSDKKLIPLAELNKLEGTMTEVSEREILLPYVHLDLDEFCHSLKEYVADISSSVGKDLNEYKSACQNLYLRMELFSLVNQFFIHGLRNSVAHVFAEQMSGDFVENKIEITAVEKEGCILLEIKTKGRILQKEGSSSVLSGQKQGLVLIEELAMKFECQMELMIDPQKNQSLFCLKVPMKYIRRKSNV